MAQLGRPAAAFGLAAVVFAATFLQFPARLALRPDLPLPARAAVPNLAPDARLVAGQRGDAALDAAGVQTLSLETAPLLAPLAGVEPDEPLLPAASPTPAVIRIARPALPSGPRRVGIQAGHWLTDQVPEELRRLETSTGTSWRGIPEWRVNLEVATRVAAALRSRGLEVDVLPTSIPPGYLADVFVALHADGDPDGVARGYKLAHGSRRGPFEDHLVRALQEEYGRVTGLPHDSGVTRNMLGYYAFSWTRFQGAVAPHTPAAILEMGFLTSAADRVVLLDRQDLVVTGIVTGLLRFLDEVPAGAAFADDLLVPAPPPRPSPTPRPA